MSSNEETFRPSEGPWVAEYHDDTTMIEGRYQTVAADVSNCDARLIAEAPELYRVAKALALWADGMRTPLDLDAIIEKARASVASAEAFP